jgi:hypothetical protein
MSRGIDRGATLGAACTLLKPAADLWTPKWPLRVSRLINLLTDGPQRYYHAVVRLLFFAGSRIISRFKTI